MNRPDFKDILTGLGVAGLMLPEGVAYAGIAGLAPGRALAAGIAGGLAYAVVGRSRFAIVSPTSSAAAILAAAIAGLASETGADAVMRGAMATELVALVGLMFLGLSLFRLGSLAGFISRPVLRGFAFGLAITIIMRQLPKVFGVSVASGQVWEIVGSLGAQVAQWHLPSMALGMAALAAILLLRRRPELPGALLVILAGVALDTFFPLTHWGIQLAGPVGLTRPDYQLPPLALLPRLAELAAPIALILFAESWGTMRSLALKHGDTLSANRELGAIGFANIASALAQGMPVGAGFSVGSANEAAGSQSRLSGVTASLAVLGLALFAGLWIARIPEPILAAVVVAALTHALSPQPILRLFHIHRDAWIALAAAIGVLCLGVLNGMLAAIALSVAHLLYHLSHPSISQLGRVGASQDFVDIARHDDAAALPGIAIFRPNAPLIFANTESVLAAVATAATASHAQIIILSLEESNDLDSTAIDALAEFAQGLTSAGKRVILARAHDQVRDILAAAGHADLATNSTYSVADAAARAGVH